MVNATFLNIGGGAAVVDLRARAGVLPSTWLLLLVAVLLLVFLLVAGFETIVGLALFALDERLTLRGFGDVVLFVGAFAMWLILVGVGFGERDSEPRVQPT